MLAHFEEKNWSFDQQFIDDNKIQITYLIKLWYFNEGHNTFTLEMDERKQLYETKKKIAVEFVKNEDYKRALKLFEKCHQLCVSGVFDEDKKQIENLALSALLNISLCYWKTKQWHEML